VVARAVCLALVAGCSQLGTSELVVQQVMPPVGPADADQPVVIEGAGFRLPITSSLDENTTIVGTVGVAIGGIELAGTDRRSDTEIGGTVLRGLAPGPHDVTVTINDQTDTLIGGYTVGVPLDPLHLAPGDGDPGTGDLVLDGAQEIDTGNMVTTFPLPSGVTFDTRPHLGGGPELAVLHVNALTITTRADVRIVGTRPFVIVAAHDVQIAGSLDASGHQIAPGPGGGLSNLGASPGSSGQHETTDASDSGGGGGGYGQNGASGGAISGACTVAGGGGGEAFGDPAITQLVGGSGGARSSGLSCIPDPGGGGGGALQISSRLRISISGRINAGGGGGRGGTDCAAASGDVNSAAGGGSGGAIVLQAPIVESSGVIAANGGAGGGSSQTGLGTGPPGQDGQLGSQAAAGGVGPRAIGGTGGTDAAPTAGGGAMCGANGAGGGGGAGRIAVSSGFTSSGVVSPAPDTSLPP
jgi:hypothetical protein